MGAETLGVGAVVGGGVAAHGLVSAGVATNDAIWTTKKLYELHADGSIKYEKPKVKEAKSPKYPKDYATKNTKNYSAKFKSERDARNLAMRKLGKDPIEIEPGKWRSTDGNGSTELSLAMLLINMFIWKN